MRSPAAAIAWEFGHRHRWGLVAVGLYFIALATVRLLVLEPGDHVTFEDSWNFALAIIVPLSSTFMYFLAVFSFGLDGDLAARESIYPVRMFTLPVTNAALTGWPMLFGAVAVAALWWVARLLALWPTGVDVPWIWPGLFAVVVLCWTQALTWTPYPFRGLRVIVTVLWLAVIDFVVFVAFELETPEPVMVALLAPLVPLAYLVARFAVVRARRGDVPDWGEAFGWLGPIHVLLSRRRDAFSSPARAQAWFEWRRHGRSLPALVGIVLPFELSLLFVFSGTRAIVFAILMVVLLTPPFMAAFVAATVRRSSPGGSDSYGLPPFIAARPLTSSSLIAAKLNATVQSTLATWMLVLAAIPLALGLSGTWPVVVDGARQVIAIMGTPRGVAMGLLGLLALVASTWKQLVQSLYIGMSGRAWLVKASVFLTLSLLTLVVLFLPWVFRTSGVIATVWGALPWIFAALVGFKICAAAWVAVRLYEGRLVRDRVLVVGALSWNVAVLALYGVLTWLVPAMIVPGYVLALVAILGIPLARLSAAPLALSWNRHR